MARKPWWPKTLPEQMSIVRNFDGKIANYESVFGWTPEQVADTRSLCGQILAAYDYVERSKATMHAATKWRDIVFSGDPKGSEAGTAPTFGPPPDMDFVRGCIQQFMKMRDRLVVDKNYTAAIGEDLGFIGPQITRPAAENVAPNLKITVTDGRNVTVAGSMQKMSAMKMLYTPEGGETREVAFFTSTPAAFTISKADPAKPENGKLQAVFYKKNLPYGAPSPNYPITIS